MKQNRGINNSQLNILLTRTVSYIQKEKGILTS